MKNMAKLGNLDITNKKFTNHSIRKTTVSKLQKAGVSNDKIMAVSGHRNEMSLKAYSDVDVDEHKKISSILSNHSKQLYPSSQHHFNSSVEHAPPTASNYYPSALPQYSFSNCSVYFNSATTYDAPKFQPVKKHRVITDSDSDE